MVDITKCWGENCPQREKCYRYLAKADELRQSYFAKVPWTDGKCKHFWEVKNENKLH